MNARISYLLAPALVTLFESAAAADLIVYELGSGASNALDSMRKSFTYGCVAIAAAIVISAYISKQR